MIETRAASVKGPAVSIMASDWGDECESDCGDSSLSNSQWTRGER